MSKKNLLSSFLVCMLCLAVLSAAPKEQDKLSSLTQEEIRTIQETYWHIELKTNVKDMQIEALQFSIFDTDPMVLLQEQRKQRQVINQGKERTPFEKQIDLEIDWDSMFSKVSGQDVYLIKSKTGKQGGPLISANNEGVNKWLVTKVAYKKDGSLCTWIIPFEAQIGKTQVLTLTDKNTFDTSSL